MSTGCCFLTIQPDIRPDTGYPANSISGATLAILHQIFNVKRSVNECSFYIKVYYLYLSLKLILNYRREISFYNDRFN